MTIVDALPAWIYPTAIALSGIIPVVVQKWKKRGRRLMEAMPPGPEKERMQELVKDWGPVFNTLVAWAVSASAMIAIVSKDGALSSQEVLMLIGGITVGGTVTSSGLWAITRPIRTKTP